MTRRSGLQLHHTNDPLRWADAARTSGSPVTPFHTYEWLELAARMTATRFSPLVVHADGADVGVVPWLARRRGPVSVVNWVPFPYAGPVVPPVHLPELLRALLRRAARHRAVVSQFSFSPLAGIPTRGVTNCGFRVHEDATFVVGTWQGADRLWANLAGRARTEIRKAERMGVVVNQPDRPEDVLARVVEEAFASRRMASPYDGDFPPRVSDLQSTDLEVHWTVARSDRGDTGSLVTLAKDAVAVVWQGGVLPQHRSLGANALMYWDSIRWASERGIRVLDLVGLPDSGIELFKSQFGGERRTYPVLQRLVPGWQLLQGTAARFKAHRQGAARRQ